MLDILVIAILVLAIKGLPGGTSIRLSWGVFAFTAAVVFSMKLPQWIKDASAAQNSSSGVIGD
jgi:hypothetical protein